MANITIQGSCGRLLTIGVNLNKKVRSNPYAFPLLYGCLSRSRMGLEPKDLIEVYAYAIDALMPCSDILQRDAFDATLFHDIPWFFSFIL